MQQYIYGLNNLLDPLHVQDECIWQGNRCYKYDIQRWLAQRIIDVMQNKAYKMLFFMLNNISTKLSNYFTNSTIYTPHACIIGSW